MQGRWVGCPRGARRAYCSSDRAALQAPSTCTPSWVLGVLSESTDPYLIEFL